MNRPKLFAFASPSGGGKTSIIKPLLKTYPEFEFSVSATTRQMRPGEVNGKDYFFLSKEEFEGLIAQGGFVEHEFFFDTHYGTLKREVDRSLNAGHSMIFDVDVKGGNTMTTEEVHKIVIAMFNDSDSRAKMFGAADYQPGAVVGSKNQ